MRTALVPGATVARTTHAPPGNCSKEGLKLSQPRLPGENRSLPLVLFFAAIVLLPQAVRAELPLMPLPLSAASSEGTLRLPSQVNYSVTGAGAADVRVAAAMVRASARLPRQTGISTTLRAGSPALLQIVVQQADRAATQQLGDNESYNLEISRDRARLMAAAPLGVVRGIETLLQLAAPCKEANAVCLPSVTIKDAPRFPWRGLSLDVSRHFIPLEGVKRTLDGMAAVKLNVLHLHLTDDQGFRVESKKYPKLQEAGSQGQFYTQAQIVELVAYARERGIRLVPEFDVPGHATSWLAAYPSLSAHAGEWEIADSDFDPHGVLDPTRDSTYQFLDGLIGEMAKLFPDEYFHIGGDEVPARSWFSEPNIRAFMRARRMRNTNRLQAYFNLRVQRIVARYGKKMIGWDDILDLALPTSVVVETWHGGRIPGEVVRRYHSEIVSTGYYLDLMQSAAQHYAADPVPEKPGLTAEHKKLILGGEAAMWTELVSAENLDAKLWPRLAAIAERLWSPETVRDADSMYERLAVVNHWLESLGLKQRSALEAMRVRLAGSHPVGPLDAFADLIEPVKRYERHKNHYPVSMPLDHLVDAIPPESDAARIFTKSVEQYIAMGDAASADAVQKQLARWAQVAQQVRPVLESNVELQENLPIADSLASLAQTGLEALAYAKSPAPLGWRDRAKEALTLGSAHHAGLMIPFVASIQKLVDAVE